MDLKSRFGQPPGWPKNHCVSAISARRSFSARALICTGLVLSGGCTPWREYFNNGFKVGPNFRTPPAPVAPQWIDAADNRIQPAPEQQPRWWIVFNDPVLNSLIESAYQQNLSLREAGFRVLQARAQLGYARGFLFPQTQTMNGDYFRDATSRNAANRSFVAQRFYDQADYGFNLAWELDFWGRFRRLVEAANREPECLR